MPKQVLYEIEPEEDDAPPVVKKTKPRRLKSKVELEDTDDIDQMLAEKRDSKLKEFISLTIKELNEKHEAEMLAAKQRLEAAELAHKAEMAALAARQAAEESKNKDKFKKQVANIKMAAMW